MGLECEYSSKPVSGCPETRILFFPVQVWMLTIGQMHLWDVPLDRLEYVRLAVFLNELFFLLGNACIKISILLVYRKISARSHSRWFIRLTWVAIAFTVAYTVGLGSELLLVCRPLSSYWKSYKPNYTGQYTCGNEQFPVVFSAAASVFSDIYASVLPTLLVSKLYLTNRQRLSLYALFSVGLLTAGIGLARMVYFVKITTNYKLGPNTHDVTWYGWPTFALTDIETHLAIICASLPALKVLFQRRTSKVANTHPSTTSNASNTIPARTPHSASQLTESWRREGDYATNPQRASDAAALPRPRSLAPEDEIYEDQRFSLQSIGSNKPLVSPSSHFSRLQRNDWRC